MKRTLALFSFAALLASGGAAMAAGNDSGQQAPANQNTPATGSAQRHPAQCERPINWCLSWCHRPDGLNTARCDQPGSLKPERRRRHGRRERRGRQRRR